LSASHERSLLTILVVVDAPGARAATQIGCTNLTRRSKSFVSIPHFVIVVSLGDIRARVCCVLISTGKKASAGNTCRHSATKSRSREQLGERVSTWLEAHPGGRLLKIAVLQTSDRAFHCISIVLFCHEEDSSESAPGY
jgi:hypothetical protein